MGVELPVRRIAGGDRAQAGEGVDTTAARPGDGAPRAEVLASRRELLPRNSGSTPAQEGRDVVLVLVAGLVDGRLAPDRDRRVRCDAGAVASAGSRRTTWGLGSAGRGGGATTGPAPRPPRAPARPARTLRAMARLRSSRPWNPVAMTVIFTSLPSRSSMTDPKMMLASGSAADWAMETASFTSKRVRLGPPVMLTSRPVAPSRVTSSSSGELMAACMASIARLLAGGAAGAHERHALAAHDGAHVGEVDVDDAVAR